MMGGAGVPVSGFRVLGSKRRTCRGAARGRDRESGWGMADPGGRGLGGKVGARARLRAGLRSPTLNGWAALSSLPLPES